MLNIQVLQWIIPILVRSSLLSQYHIQWSTARWSHVKLANVLAALSANCEWMIPGPGSFTCLANIPTMSGYTPALRMGFPHPSAAPLWGRKIAQKRYAKSLFCDSYRLSHLCICMHTSTAPINLLWKFHYLHQSSLSMLVNSWSVNVSMFCLQPWHMTLTNCSLSYQLLSRRHWNNRWHLIDNSSWELR